TTHKLNCDILRVVSIRIRFVLLFFFFFFNATATTEIYTLSLHDALPIFIDGEDRTQQALLPHSLEDYVDGENPVRVIEVILQARSEEHTSELQSQSNLVCRLLLEKKKKNYVPRSITCMPSI